MQHKSHMVVVEDTQLDYSTNANPTPIANPNPAPILPTPPVDNAGAPVVTDAVPLAMGVTVPFTLPFPGSVSTLSILCTVTLGIVTFPTFWISFTNTHLN
jgi:hypothetical protein